MDGQKNEKISTLPQAAFNGDVTAEAFDNPMGNRETDTRPLFPGFGGEKGLEDPMQNVGRYPRSGVADGELDKTVAAAILIRSQQLVFIFRCIVQPNGHLAWFPFHGLGGIGAKVHNDLLKLGCIHNRLGLAADVAVDLDGGR